MKGGKDAQSTAELFDLRSQLWWTVFTGEAEDLNRQPGVVGVAHDAHRDEDLMAVVVDVSLSLSLSRSFYKDHQCKPVNALSQKCRSCQR